MYLLTYIIITVGQYWININPGPFLETREQELSLRTKIDVITCFIVEI